MNNKIDEVTKAASALSFIVPIIKKYNFRWVITGGFACYVYGVDRMLTDIDIDLDTSKDTAAFLEFLRELEPYITQPLENFVDENYDNFNFEITYEGQIIDFCPMKDLMIFNKANSKYERFYKNGFPEVEVTKFQEFDLPLLIKQAIINNKEMLTKKDKWQERDISELRKLTKKH